MGCMNCTGTDVCVAQHIFVLSRAFAPELAHVQLYCVTTRCAKTGGDIAVNAASWTLCAPEICSVMRFGCACSMRAALLGMEKTRHMERHTWCRMRLRKYSMYRLHRHAQLGPQSRSMEEALSVPLRYEHQLHGSVHGHGQVFLAMQRRSPHVMRTDVD